MHIYQYMVDHEPSKLYEVSVVLKVLAVVKAWFLSLVLFTHSHTVSANVLVCSELPALHFLKMKQFFCRAVHEYVKVCVPNPRFRSSRPFVISISATWILTIIYSTTVVLVCIWRRTLSIAASVCETRQVPTILQRPCHSFLTVYSELTSTLPVINKLNLFWVNTLILRHQSKLVSVDSFSWDSEESHKEMKLQNASW